MRQLLKSPTINAVCISLFTAFYAVIFFVTGHHKYIATALTAVTAIVVVLLLTRRKPHDEYHTAILTNCLVIASIMTLIAIAIFYLIILADPTDIIEKFTLFIAIHWTTVVFANLIYVLLCRKR